MVAPRSENIAGVGERRERIVKLLAPAFAAEGDRQRTGRQSIDVPRRLRVDQQRRTGGAMEVAVDLRAREQRLAFGSRRTERVDEPGGHRIDQLALRNVAAREIVALSIRAVEDRRVVVPAKGGSVDADDRAQRVRIDVVEPIAERHCPIPEAQVARQAIGGRELRRVERTSRRVKNRQALRAEAPESGRGLDRQAEAMVRVTGLGEELNVGA